MKDSVLRRIEEYNRLEFLKDQQLQKEVDQASAFFTSQISKSDQDDSSISPVKRAIQMCQMIKMSQNLRKSRGIHNSLKSIINAHQGKN